MVLEYGSHPSGDEQTSNRDVVGVHGFRITPDVCTPILPCLHPGKYGGLEDVEQVR